MKKTLLATLLAAGAVVCASSAFATDSVDLKVIGTITPVACTPTLSGGGTVDYGTIKADTLKADDYTVLPLKSLDFSITCDGNAKVAVKAFSGRMGTTVGDDESTSGASSIPAGITLLGRDSTINTVQAFGLGLNGTKKIGGYAMRIAVAGAKADGVEVDSIARNFGSVWAKPGTNIISAKSDRNITWATTGTLTPVAFKTLASSLDVQAFINKASELDITKPIQLDGLATLELIYL
ncbi:MULTISPECIES: DUF1120 domain-containing protein [Serratia]|uniref:Protein of uncharacterized function (DUF1120) n=1 Tax=Serratia quinivorans TaxID=137545 RepID=A0A379YXD2_9GAMM|nr:MULTISPECIES: DUF1120 domain-containing protein [Serratia]RYM60804.1 hypothetical protein BSR03_12660 [Serratia proteamaculans]CAI1738307.1 Protein of uncharacterised function (DUF1120) [Serratia quinivorans]SUI51444.1 Protein of uncharacterised function (DUF1120) [Serratia quinivorans]